MTAVLWWCAVGVAGTFATVAASALVRPRARAGWVLISAGAVVVCVTGMVSGLLDLTGRDLTVLLLAPGVLAYPLMLAGLLLIRRATGVLRAGDTLDALVAALGAFLIGWIALWHPHYRANGVLLTSTVVHPIGALVVFTASVAVAFSRCLGPLAGTLLVAATAVLLAMTSILAVTVTETTLGVTEIAVVPVLWALLPLLLTATALVPWSPRPVATAPGPTALSGWRVAMIVTCAVLGPIAWGVIVAADPPRRALTETVIPVSTDAVLSLLVLVRLLLTSAALQRIREELADEATRDPLTGLPNRTALMTALDEAFAVERERAPALLLFDLDGFKQANDNLGHLVGDGVLLAVADRVTRAAPATATVARLGGDEFAVVVPDTDPGRAAALAERICADLRRPYSVRGHELRISASLGVVHADSMPYTPTDALHHADVALYAAKAAGGGLWMRYPVDGPP